MEITLLDKEACSKNIDGLFNNDLFNNIGADARVTDFAFLTGTEVEDALVDLKYGTFLLNHLVLLVWLISKFKVFQRITVTLIVYMF